MVLESPTGTGKSAAILCSVLAWQRYHYKMTKAKKNADLRDNINMDGDSDGIEESQKVKIFYCSRTHSQVAQMVAS